MTASSLRDYSCKDLAQMAKSEGLPGWHSMRKEELVRALVNHARRKQKTRGSGQTNGGASRIADHFDAECADKRRSSLETEEQLHQLRERLSGRRQLAAVQSNESSRVENDRLVVMVRDPYWLHVYWELAQRSVERRKQRWDSTGIRRGPFYGCSSFQTTVRPYCSGKL